MKERLTNVPMILTAALWTAAPLAQASADSAGGGHYGWDGGWGHMMSGSLTMVLFLGLVILGIVFTVRWLAGRSSAGAGSPAAGQSSLEILRERFARGEIDKEEFDDRKRALAE